MKGLLMLLLLLPASAMAQANVSFAWDPFPAGSQPSGVEMDLAPVAPNTAKPISFDCGAALANTCTVTAIPAGKWSATARAYNTGDPVTLKQFSGPSNAVSLTVPAAPAIPQILRIGTATMALRLQYDGNAPPLYLGLIFTPRPVQ